ncbi:MAG: PAS domain S-box protein [Chloroflexi bacterium]|nr:PAS domain S-box protein [Chloroflexota bacterium]
MKLLWLFSTMAEFMNSFSATSFQPAMEQPTLAELTQTIARLEAELATTKQALLASEQRNLQFFQQTQAIELIVEPDTWRVLAANAAACRFYGYSQAEFSNINVRDLNVLTSKEHRVAIRNGELGGSNRYEFRHRLRSGMVCDVEVYITPFEYQQQPALFCLIHDVTAHKQTIRQMQRQNAYLGSLHDVTLALIEQAALPDLLEIILWKASDLVGSEYGVMYIRSADDQAMESVVSRGAINVIQRIELGQGAVGKVGLSGQPLIIDDYTAWSERLFTPQDGFGNGLLVLPLFREQTVAGALAIIYEPSQIQISITMLEMVQQFARFASLALEKHMLYTAAQTELAERRRVEQQLRSLNERFELAQTVLNGGIYDWDMIQQTTVVNRSFTTVFGYTSEEVASSPTWWEEHLHPDDRELFIQRTADIFAGHSDVFSAEYRFLDQHQHYRFVQDRGHVLRDPNGQALRMVGTLIDISEEYRHIVEMLPLPLFVVQDDRIVYANQAGLALTQTTSSELLSQSVLSGLRPQDPDDFYVLIRHASTIPTSFIETTFLRRDGTPIYGECSTSAILFEHRNSVQVIIRDISERKQAEQKRLEIEQHFSETQKLESLGVFAGGIAHDFNNVFMSILGNTHLAMLELPEQANLRPLLAEIEQSAKRAAQITKQMVAYTGQNLDVRRSLMINELVQTSIRLLPSSLTQQRHIQSNLADNLPLIEGDQQHLRQAISNVLINALEASSSGTLTVTTSLRDLQGAPEGHTYTTGTFLPAQYIAIEISDQGLGMDHATISRMFDPFFTTKFTGRGLGLAVTLGIVRGHRGGIAVKSRPQQGTTIGIYLPIMTAVQTELASEQPALVDSGPGKILVIDDEPDVRIVIDRILRRLGYETLLAEGGNRGISLFRDHHHEIAGVFLDLTMPDLDGQSTLAVLKQIQPEIRVVIMSGYNEQQVSQQFGTTGTTQFLAKPFMIEEIRDKLTALRL